MSSLAKSNPNLAVNMIVGCLRKASKYGGKVFGGYVRDVIVPRLDDRNCAVEFKDVDVWFREQGGADSFVKAMGKSFFLGRKTDCPLLYKFTRQQYMFFQYDTFVANFDIIVSNELPVDDFDVNRLTYHVGDNEFIPYSGSEAVEYIKRSIINKTATMLPEYKEKLTRVREFPLHLNPDTAQIHIDRLKNRYLERGWTIRVETSKGWVVIPRTVNASWIRDNLVDHSPIDVKSPAVTNPSSKESSVNRSNAEALAAFNAGLEAIRTAFMKVLESK